MNNNPKDSIPGRGEDELRKQIYDMFLKYYIDTTWTRKDSPSLKQIMDQIMPLIQAEITKQKNIVIRSMSILNQSMDKELILKVKKEAREQAQQELLDRLEIFTENTLPSGEYAYPVMKAFISSERPMTNEDSNKGGAK